MSDREKLVKNAEWRRYVSNRQRTTDLRSATALPGFIGHSEENRLSCGHRCAGVCARSICHACPASEKGPSSGASDPLFMRADDALFATRPSRVNIDSRPDWWTFLACVFRPRSTHLRFPPWPTRRFIFLFSLLFSYSLCFLLRLYPSLSVLLHLLDVTFRKTCKSPLIPRTRTTNAITPRSSRSSPIDEISLLTSREFVATYGFGNQ